MEALDLAGEPAISAAVKEKADLGPASRPNLTRMIELLLAAKPPGERFGPVTLCAEVNRQLEIEAPIHATPVSSKVFEAGEFGLYRSARRDGVLL